MEENCQLFDGLLSKLFKLVMFQSLVSLLGLVFEITTFLNLFIIVPISLENFQKVSRSDHAVLDF